MFELIKQYGELIRMAGNDRPVFCMTPQTKELILSNPEKVSGADYISYGDLPGDDKAVPGAIGKYDGVLLVVVIR